MQELILVASKIDKKMCFTNFAGVGIREMQFSFLTFFVTSPWTSIAEKLLAERWPQKILKFY